MYSEGLRIQGTQFCIPALPPMGCMPSGQLLTSPCLSFLISNMKRKIVPSSETYCKTDMI